MKITDIEKCIGCGLCVSQCPKECISLSETERGYRIPVVDESKCIECGLCSKKCPGNNIEPYNNISQNDSDHTRFNYERKHTYCTFSRNEEIRQSSSSGGVFYHLATHVLEKGGVVYGAAYDDEFNVCHKKITTVEEIPILQTSKYVESDMTHIYKNIKEDLKQGKIVLFSGTPCQNALMRELYDNKFPKQLVLVDFLCHGVPGAGFYHKYIDTLMKKYRGKIRQVQFREKSAGWKSFNIDILFDNQKRHSFYVNEDYYMRLFLSDFICRDSCYDCLYRYGNNKSDITIADAWGSNKYCDITDDDGGLSLVIIHNEKGNDLFCECINELQYVAADFDYVLNNNSAIKGQMKKPLNREHLISDYMNQNQDLLYTMDHYSGLKKKQIIKRRIKLFIRTIGWNKKTRSK